MDLVSAAIIIISHGNIYCKKIKPHTFDPLSSIPYTSPPHAPSSLSIYLTSSIPLSQYLHKPHPLGPLLLQEKGKTFTRETFPLSFKGDGIKG